MVAVRRATNRVKVDAVEPALSTDRNPGARAISATTRYALRRPLIRRRRTVLVCLAVAASLAVAAIGTGSPGVWGWFVAVVAITATYLGLLHRLRRIAAEREFATILGPSLTHQGTSAHQGASAHLGILADFPPMPSSPVEGALPDAHLAEGGSAYTNAFALARFALANVAGWALSPIVFTFTLLVGETPKDTTGQRWLDALQGAQQRLKDQSLRTIAVSAATTASVTAAGTVAVFGASSVASAATAPASASAPIGSSLAASAGATPARASNAYRVVAGDTLSSIAARFGTTTAALAAINHLSNPNLIYRGQILHIVGGPGSTTAISAGTYTVVAGDTLVRIADRFGTTTAALVAINHLSNPNLIYAGQTLRVGGAIPGAPNATLISTTRSERSNASGDAAGTPPGRAPIPEPAVKAGAPSPAGEVAAQVALAQVGRPYAWAGATPGGFDCSGLVMYAWAHAGASLPHYSVAQYRNTTRISESALRSGDLVFYDNGSGAQPGHVTIYIGGGEVVTSDSPGTTVRVVPLDWDGVPIGFGRVG